MFPYSCAACSAINADCVPKRSRKLHGLPVLVKNNIGTLDKMNNTGKYMTMKLRPGSEIPPVTNHHPFAQPGRGFWSAQRCREMQALLKSFVKPEQSF